MTTRPVMSILAAKAALDAATALVTGGVGATIQIFTGTAPTKTVDADTGTKLSTLTMNATPFPGSTSGTLDGLATATANAIASDTNAAASGTAGYFRLKSSTPTVIFQGNVGTSGTDLNFNTNVFTAGDTIAITSFKITLPCGDGAT